MEFATSGQKEGQIAMTGKNRGKLIRHLKREWHPGIRICSGDPKIEHCICDFECPFGNKEEFDIDYDKLAEISHCILDHLIKFTRGMHTDAGKSKKDCYGLL